MIIPKQLRQIRVRQPGRPYDVGLVRTRRSLPRMYRGMKVTPTGQPIVPIKLASPGYYSKSFAQTRLRKIPDPQGNVYTGSLGDEDEVEGLGELGATGIPIIDSVIGQVQPKLDKLELSLKIITPASVIAAVTGLALLLRRR